MAREDTKTAGADGLAQALSDDKTAQAEQLETQEQPVQTRSLDELVQALSGPSRKERQNSAHEICLLAQTEPEALLPHLAALTDAVSRPEAQTRWEILDAFCALISLDCSHADGAVEAALDALYDEESGMLRATAFRFFTARAASGKKQAAQAWPLLDEALQCFHGDPEYLGMLDALIAFLEAGPVDRATAEAIVARMDFDAQNSKGRLGLRSRRIVELAKQGGSKSACTGSGSSSSEKK